MIYVLFENIIICKHAGILQKKLLKSIYSPPLSQIEHKFSYLLNIDRKKLIFIVLFTETQRLVRAFCGQYSKIIISTLNLSYKKTYRLPILCTLGPTSRVTP